MQEEKSLNLPQEQTKETKKSFYPAKFVNLQQINWSTGKVEENHISHYHGIHKEIKKKSWFDSK